MASDPAGHARRDARRERWRRPLATKQDRLAAWASLMLTDHGVLRLFYRNRHQVSERLWRSAQPAPSDLAFAARRGIRTVLSLRSDGFGGDLLEREACQQYGLAFERLVLYSRGAPPRETLREAMARFPKLEPPVLLHCKSGADRAGLGAALYLMIAEEVPAKTAMAQLSPRYGHIKSARTGILDAFFEAYVAAGAEAAMPFCEWVETIYDPEALTKSFVPTALSDALLALMRRE
ncbi:MAG: sulfur transferase domain-containing protein [Pseudomonadota bacterium]